MQPGIEAVAAWPVATGPDEDSLEVLGQEFELFFEAYVEYLAAPGTVEVGEADDIVAELTSDSDPVAEWSNDIVAG